MPRVRLTRHQFTYFPRLEGQDIVVEAATAADVVAALDALAPGIGFYICDERGRLRAHVNVFVGTSMIRDRATLSDAVGPGDDVHILHTPEPDAEWGHDTHFIDQCESDPDHIWQQNHVGVYKSDDAAQSWRKISRPDLGVHFGFPITADGQNGLRAWVVPGKSDQQRTALDGGLFVARTEDGGHNWTPQRRGLPQEHAYDVVYRHALANAGGAVAFGTTTGNLYVSDDGGEQCVTVANNLPPIYSVRFG